jgi:hypothetical protein
MYLDTVRFAFLLYILHVTRLLRLRLLSLHLSCIVEKHMTQSGQRVRSTFVISRIVIASIGQGQRIEEERCTHQRSVRQTWLLLVRYAS